MFKFNSFESSLRSPAKLSLKPSSPFLNRKSLKIEPKTDSKSIGLTSSPNSRQKNKPVHGANQVESVYERHVDSGLESLSSNSSSDTVDCENPTKPAKTIALSRKIEETTDKTCENDETLTKLVTKPVMGATQCSETVNGSGEITGEETGEVCKVNDVTPSNGSEGSCNDKEVVKFDNDSKTDDGSKVAVDRVVPARSSDVTLGSKESDSDRKPNELVPEEKDDGNRSSVVLAINDLRADDVTSFVQDKVANRSTSEGGVSIECSEINKTNIVLRADSATKIEVPIKTNELDAEPREHSLIISLHDENAVENSTPNDSQDSQNSDSKVTVKVVGEILKKDNVALKNVPKSVKKSLLPSSKPNITDMILTTELMLKSPKCTDRKVFKKNSQPIFCASGKPQVSRKTSEPAYATQAKTGGKLPLIRKISHDETKSSAHSLSKNTENPKTKTQILGKPLKLNSSDETLTKKLKSLSDDSRSETQSIVSSSSAESLHGIKSLKAIISSESCNVLEAWETASVQSEASTVDDSDSPSVLDKMKKNITEEEYKNLRKRRIERNIAHNNNKNNIVSNHIKQFQNEIEKLKPLQRKSSGEKPKASRTDSFKKEIGEVAKAIPVATEHKSLLNGIGLERKPSFNTKHVTKINTPRVKSFNRSWTTNGGLTKNLKSWSETTSIEEALVESEMRRNGVQTYKDLKELFGEENAVSKKELKELLNEKSIVVEENKVNRESVFYLNELVDKPVESVAVKVDVLNVASKDLLDAVDNKESLPDLGNKDAVEVSGQSAEILAEAKSEEQLASEKAWLAAEPLWLVHRAGFTRVRPLSPLSPPPPGLSSRDGKVRVQVEGSGLELTVDEDDLEKCNPAQYDTCEDICSARHLNESSVLHTLRLRYASNLIHTNAGPTAIVLNPVAPLAIYSDKVAQLFKGCSSEDTPPHIFATAQALYRSLLGTRRDHALVPMGRSGAGKTTSMQHALRYLALTADSTSKILTPDKLNAIAIVLEAFGHARTCLNLNATRVSHIFSLDFDMTGAIASASIQLLLLDKQRVVRRSEGESNFHVFYRLLSGADSTLRKELMLDAITGGGEANQFIIPYSKHEDKQRGLMDFVRLCAALTTLGTTEAELKAVFSLLAAVLHLGAAGAVKGSGAAGGKWQFQSPGAASRAAKVLGLAPDSLARALFSPQGPAGGGSPGSPGGGGTLGRRTAGSSPGGGGTEEASGQEMVESFAMSLYAEAFNSVGGLINRSLASSSSHSVCSLLLVDTPGFQNPASTGLNQLGAGFSDLCFNYLQERLSLLFHHSSLVTPKDLYSQEHIEIPGLDLSDPDDEFSSPSALVSLLDNSPSPGPAYNSLGHAHSQDRKPPGLLWLLDELTSGGVGSSPSSPPTFPDLVFGNFSEKEYHGLLRKAPGAHHFIVQHNLGTNPVLYNSEGWARQLREPSTPRALLALLSESTHKHLAALVGSSRGGGLSGGTYDLGAGGTVRGVTSLRRTTTGGFAKRRSVPVQVKSAVDSLIETIRRTHLQFAHCLLPHHHAGLVDTRSLAPTAAPFDSLVNVPLLRSQLRGAQLLPAARLHKQGYPHHLPLAEFRRRYALLAAPPDSAPGSETPRADSATQPPPLVDDRVAVEEILLSLDLDASSYRVGLSQIFFRSHVLPQLEAERDKKLSSRVIAFQAQCRGYLARKHLAKLKVQDVAVRCIQRNVRKSLQVRDWSWWRLYLKIHPILNVHRTDQELKAKTEELEALKSKLEKLEVERNILKQDNTRLESKLGEITEDYADEHSTATLATERLHIESAERARLERELAEAQSANKRLAETSDKLEAEMQCLRSTDALSLEAEEESGGGSEGDVVYRKKWERAMRELELAKHRLSTQHQDDLEQMVGLRKQLEKKIADAHEQTDEQRQVAAEWKRKQTRLSSELADTRLLLEEQSSRNNLLEKKQRKFDAEFSLLQDELRQERNLKEKAMRDKELALGDKYTMEQSMSSLKLELELKDTKLAGLASELEELQFSSNTEEEVAALKKKKHALEARLKDQEEELDELAGQVQMLEQAKLKVEMSLEQMRKAHRKELSCKDEELEALRCSTQKKVKALQSQLESEHDSRSSLLRERHEMERRLSALADQGVATQAADAETMQRLKRDLKRTKALLKDTQTMLAQARQDNPNRLLLRQLRNQLEDAELARSVATKARLSLESDLADLTLSLEETSRAKGELEARLSEALRERSSLQSTLDENEEEMTEVLKKYQASVAQLSSEQAQLQEAATRVAELEADNAALKEQLADLSGRLESIEAHGDPSSTLALKRLMLKGKELESKLEFEHTTRSRLEVQISRLKETSDKLQAECNLLRGKDNSHSQEARRLQRSIRELKETVQGLEARGVNEALKRKELEKEVQCREAEIASLKNELSVSSQRIQDLQHAIQGDLDDEYDDEDDSDASSDQDQDISSDDEDYTSHQEDEVYTSKDTLRSCSDAGR